MHKENRNLNTLENEKLQEFDIPDCKPSPSKIKKNDSLCSNSMKRISG